jgi:Kef-type K+ transport system membrane component KefB
MNWVEFTDLVITAGNFFNNKQPLVDIIVILIAVKLFGQMSILFGQPSVFGKILAGIIIGPAFLGFVNPGPMVNGLADIGVILLMFLAGLETNVFRLLNNFRAATYAAFLGACFPLITGFIAGLLFGYGRGEAAFIGVVLVATSVSITVQVLREMGKLQTKAGFTILGAAVLDDIIGLVVLSIVFGISVGGLNPLHIGAILIRIGLFFLMAVVVGTILLPLIFKLTSKMKVSVPLLTMCIVIALAYAVTAQYMGLAGIIGAYLAGLMVRVINQGENLLRSIEIVGYSFFIPFFFAGIGLSIEFKQISSELVFFTLIIILIALLTKLIGCSLGAYLGGISPRESLVVGAGMVARGEVALIVAKFGVDSGLINSELFTVMVIVTIITTIMSPPIIRFSYKGR